MVGAATPPQYQAVYRACIKQAAGQGAALMQATLRRGLAELPAQAEAISDVVERNLLLEALAVAREQQQVLAEAFPQALLAEVASAIAGDRASSLSFESLPLLADDQVQDNVHVVRAAQALQEAVQAELAAFEALLAAAQLAPAGDAQRHPLRPEVYVRALYRLARQSPVAATVRRRWLRYLPLAMAPELAATYVALAGTLEGQGVVAPPPAPAAAPSATDPSADRATQLTIRELKQLLAGEPPPLAVLDPTVAEPPPPDFTHTVPAAFQALQDLRKVDQLLLQLRQRQAAMPESAAGSREDFRRALHGQTRTPAQALGLEVVHVMVENLADDPRLLPPVQDAVRDLEPALLRLALADPRFFSDRGHPARRMLEQVTQRSLAWTSVDAPGFREFLDGLQQAVEVLLEARAAGTEPFEIALGALRDAWAEAQPRGRRGRERAVRALLRAEQRNLLAERIADQIRARPDALGAPAEALAFLTGPWAQVMAQARLSDDSGYDDPGGYGALVQTLLWSVQPTLVARAAHQHAHLIARIEAGLESIEHPPAETQRWQALLRQQRVLAQYAAAGAEPHISEPVPLPATPGTWLAPPEMQDSGFVPEPGRAERESETAGPESLPQPELHPGAWVELPAEGGDRLQLTWSSPHGLLFLFTQSGGATRSMTRRRVQQMLADGSMRVVSQHAVVDGALDAVARAAWRNSVWGG
ncbi:DUF1631 family protein [Ramlibacter agri]|nr:DUF1631 family protein [Ramlibacter agri]